MNLVCTLHRANYDEDESNNLATRDAVLQRQSGKEQPSSNLCGEAAFKVSHVATNKEQPPSNLCGEATFDVEDELVDTDKEQPSSNLCGEAAFDVDYTPSNEPPYSQSTSDEVDTVLFQPSLQSNTSFTRSLTISQMESNNEVCSLTLLQEGTYAGYEYIGSDDSSTDDDGESIGCKFTVGLSNHDSITLGLVGGKDRPPGPFPCFDLDDYTPTKVRGKARIFSVPDPNKSELSCLFITGKFNGQIAIPCIGWNVEVTQQHP
jgi:hypothetical protein